MVKARMRWVVGVAAGATLLSTALTGLGVAQATTKHKTYNVAYMSYGVANSYDAPMLAAAKAVAAADGVKVTVFDSEHLVHHAGVPAPGRHQLRAVPGRHPPADLRRGADPEVKIAIEKKIKVVNIDQILGTNYTTDQIQVQGLYGNVVFFPVAIGTQLATLAERGVPGDEPLPDRPRSTTTSATSPTRDHDGLQDAAGQELQRLGRRRGDGALQAVGRPDPSRTCWSRTRASTSSSARTRTVRAPRRP